MKNGRDVNAINNSVLRQRRSSQLHHRSKDVIRGNEVYRCRPWSDLAGHCTIALQDLAFEAGERRVDPSAS